MTYAAEVAADSPVAWWKLNELSGTSAADSGSGAANNGTYTGGFTLGSEGMDGLDAGGGTSVRFNGSTGYVDLGSIVAKLQFASGVPFSVEAWTLFPSGVTTPGAALVTETYSGDGTVRYMLGFHNGGSNTLKPSFGWYNGSWRLALSGSDLSGDTWHHLVGTFDGTQLRLYVDGALAAGPTTPGGVQPGGTESFYIGRRWDNNGEQYYNGRIDEVAIYGSELSAARVSAHYAALNPTPINPLRQISQALAEAAIVPDAANRQFSQVLGEVAWVAEPDRQVSQEMVEVAWRPLVETSDVLSTIATLDHDLIIGVEEDQHHPRQHPLDANDGTHTGGLFYKTGVHELAITDADFINPVDGMIAVTYGTELGTHITHRVIWARANGVWRGVEA